MMIPSEPILDPNVAAYYVHHYCWPVEVYTSRPIALSPWARLFTYWVTFPAPVGPDECRRVGPRTLHMGERFRARMELYVFGLRCEVRERLEAMRESSAA